MPDILVFHDSHAIGLELKSKTTVSKVQWDMFSKLGSAGVPVYVCTSIDDVYRALTIANKVPMRKFNYGYPLGRNPQAKARRPPEPDAGSPQA